MMNSKAKPAGSDGENKGDAVCAICDNGGNLTCCDGGCKRSFHLDESEGSACRLALGLTKDEAKRIMDTEEGFVCKNCEYKQHQCFACGLLGSSDLSSSKPEVFQCEHGDCGRFYHPKCVANLLYPDGEEEATLFEHQVAAGLEFPCPMHECCVCREGENKEDEEMQFAVCRRCPTTYHRKCLPEEILFRTKKGPNGAMCRAWDDVLPDRILIYCMKHDIVRKLKTASRDHIVFPDAEKLTTKVPDAEKLTTKVPDAEKLTVKVPDAEKLTKVSGTSVSPRFAASNTNQCFCSGHMDSFAPKSLFMHPQPGSCGWISDED
ncbi:hypothetical protein PR202_gb19451 [Eleusine coracana subsp. coracana]|uniref:Zinc finger PHD-type domain-containing protein n=1 Tax=Eleusine coracana subsp. coracana TaxID=191504 RepID=A0AAV5F9Y4_ELECO|nr:hypothetical protein PR202_gb19451 [Eleusine coracana subsp. coracana]